MNASARPPRGRERRAHMPSTCSARAATTNASPRRDGCDYKNATKALILSMPFLKYNVLRTNRLNLCPYIHPCGCGAHSHSIRKYMHESFHQNALSFKTHLCLCRLAIPLFKRKVEMWWWVRSAQVCWSGVLSAPLRGGSADIKLSSGVCDIVNRSIRQSWAVFLPPAKFGASGLAHAHNPFDYSLSRAPFEQVVRANRPLLCFWNNYIVFLEVKRQGGVAARFLEDNVDSEWEWKFGKQGETEREGVRASSRV